MPTRVDTTPASALLVVHDADTRLPAVEGDDRTGLEREAATGRVFYLAAEDPLRFRVDVYTDEAPPGETARDFQPLGGSFLLDLPSGRLCVRGYDGASEAASPPAALLPSGSYRLTVMERRPFDGRRYQAQMIARVGEADWRLYERANRLALLGCLPTVAVIIGVLAAFKRGGWTGFLTAALPIALLSWLPHVVLRRSRRYRRVERQMSEHDASMPTFILALTPTDRSAGLAGGFVNV